MSTQAPRWNWAGNYQYSTGNVLTPATLAEVQDAVRSAARVRPLGSCHSFNGIADSTTAQLSTVALNVLTLDGTSRTVTVGGGIRYGELAVELDRAGFALHNMASLPHISVAGSVATGTHGSGLRNGSLATAVRGLEIVAADGSVHRLSRDRDRDRFAGAVVSLGALGVVTSLTLKVEPRYEMTQVVYQGLDFRELGHNLEEIMSAGYSVSLFTTWQPRAWEIWIKRYVEAGGVVPVASTFHGATLAIRKLHPVPEQDAEKTTDQMNIAGAWHDRLPHFKMEFTPSAGTEIQSEFFVPFEHGYDALAAIESLRDAITPHLYVSEIRAVAADDLWMSMAYGRRSLAIHFTWRQEPEAVLRIISQIEAKLAPFQPRPHWGKVFTLSAAQLASVYPRWGDFKKLAREFDPTGKFSNAFLDHTLWAD